MKKELVLCLVTLSFGILLVNLNLTFAEYDMTQGSDWKWAYAQSHIDADLTPYNINDADIEFARMRVNASREDCEENWGPEWCPWYEEDKATLERMIKAKTNLPAIPKSESGSAWQKFMNFLKNLFKF